VTKVFVYGTLKQGYNNSYLLGKSRFLGKAKTISLHVMLNGGFPYVSQETKKGAFSGQVVGEVFEVDDATLKRLDGLEGYNPAHPEYSHYLRKPVWLMIDDHAELAYMYQMTDRMNKPVMAAAHSKKAIRAIKDKIFGTFGRSPIKPEKGQVEWGAGR
jgi:gamma-glutamylcyclotransferase (GGCT)/AIG2-like uncharacterized protein YtfP